MRQPPVIVIPATEETAHTPHNLRVNRTYTDLVERVGGVALLVARPKDADSLEAIIRVADGLLLIGGSDIDPKHYNEESRSCISINAERDQVEFALIHRVLEKKIPVLGICRGAQVMNVALGGSLYQDIGKELAGALEHDPHRHGDTNVPRNFIAHNVRVVEDSLLYRLVKETSLKVNSRHHQGIKQLGKTLAAVAHAPDGLVEAIEINDYPFGLGIEWHPEDLGDVPSKNIFQGFVDAARAR